MYIAYPRIARTFALTKKEKMEKRIKTVWILTIITAILIIGGQGYWLHHQYCYSTKTFMQELHKQILQLEKEEMNTRYDKRTNNHKYTLSYKIEMPDSVNQNGKTTCIISFYRQQSEIDNLLKQLSEGDLDVDQIQGEDDKQVKNYDFSRPTKFSKEHLRTLEIIFEHYSRLISTNLPVYLRKNVQVSVASSETVTFSEFSNALSNPSVLGIVNFAPLNGNIIIEIATNLCYAMLDRMLGGSGQPLEKSRDFSDIELTILQKLLVMFTQLMREPWKNVVEISPVLSRLETNPQFAQVIAPSDMIAIVTLNMKIGDVEGMVNICLPFFTLEDVMDKLNTKYWFSTMQENHDEHYEEYIESMIRRVDIPIKAVLGKSTISVNDFLNLQVGDCIRLDSRVDTDMNVYVGNIKKFTALPGTDRDSYAVQITSVIREEE